MSVMAAAGHQHPRKRSRLHAQTQICHLCAFKLQRAMQAKTHHAGQDLRAVGAHAAVGGGPMQEFFETPHGPIIGQNISSWHV